HLQSTPPKQPVFREDRGGEPASRPRPALLGASRFLADQAVDERAVGFPRYRPEDGLRLSLRTGEESSFLDRAAQVHPKLPPGLPSDDRMRCGEGFLNVRRNPAISPCQPPASEHKCHESKSAPFQSRRCPTCAIAAFRLEWTAVRAVLPSLAVPT